MKDRDGRHALEEVLAHTDSEIAELKRQIREHLRDLGVTGTSNEQWESLTRHVNELKAKHDVGFEFTPRLDRTVGENFSALCATFVRWVNS